jgi:hypothetical protein
VLRPECREPGPGLFSGPPAARFGGTYAREPDQLVKDLGETEPIAGVDTLLLIVPNQLGVDYNAHLIEPICRAGGRLGVVISTRVWVASAGSN